MHTGSYCLMSADGSGQPTGQARGQDPAWPVRSSGVATRRRARRQRRRSASEGPRGARRAAVARLHQISTTHQARTPRAMLDTELVHLGDSSAKTYQITRHSYSAGSAVIL